MLKTIKSIDTFFLISLLLILIFPLFPTYLGNNSFHIIPIAIILSLILILKNKTNFILDRGIIKPNLFFFTTFILLLISLINDSFYVASTGVKDFLGIIKPFYSYVFFLVGYTSIIDNGKKIMTLCRFFEIMIILSFILAFLEVFYLDQLKSILYFLYKRQERIVLIDKATGWFGVTYYFSYFISFLCYYSFFILTTKRNVRSFLMFAISLITIFLTQSRTLILALAFGFTILPFLKQSFKNKTVYLFYIALLVIVIYLGFNYSEYLEEKLGYAYVGILRLFEEGVNIYGSEEGSANVRINQFWWAWNNNEYKIIGFGLARDGEVFLESVYAYYMYRLGIVYLALFILLLVYFSRISSKLAVKFKKNKFFYSFFSACSMFYLISPIALFASASHEMPKIAFVFFICTGIVYRFHYKNKKT